MRRRQRNQRKKTRNQNVLPGFGTRLRRARHQAGLTVIACSQIAGVTHQSLTQWEADQTTPALNKLPRLSRALNVSADWLLGLTHTRAPAR